MSRVLCQIEAVSYLIVEVEEGRKSIEEPCHMMTLVWVPPSR